MQRIVPAAALLLAVGCLTGCQDKKKKMETDPAQQPTVAYEGTNAGYRSGTDANMYPDPASSVSTDAGYGSSPTAASPTSGTKAASGTGVHTVAKGDTLYSLARLYYSDQSKWKVIYNANKAAIPDPNHLKVGQQLTIP
jgi:nucleoid-associated protein YgaU